MIVLLVFCTLLFFHLLSQLHMHGVLPILTKEMKPMPLDNKKLAHYLIQKNGT
jgi:hypothetical protein